MIKEPGRAYAPVVPELSLRTAPFISWVAERGALDYQHVYNAVAALVTRLSSEPPGAQFSRWHARKSVGRADIARAVRDYYAPGLVRGGPIRLYETGLYSGIRLDFTIATQDQWLGGAVPLGGNRERFRFLPKAMDPLPVLTELGIDAAIERLSYVERHPLTGNRRGWIIGHFLDKTGDGIRATDDVEIKWATHRAGEQRANWHDVEHRTTVVVLISGGFRIDLSVQTFFLTNQGDYLMWGPGIGHSWKAEEDSIVLTIRWPSLTK